MASILEAVLDEIALEGLDGITFDALWTRLKQRIDFIESDIIQDAEDRQKFFLFDPNLLQSAKFLDKLFQLILCQSKKGKH